MSTPSEIPKGCPYGVSKVRLSRGFRGSTAGRRQGQIKKSPKKDNVSDNMIEQTSSAQWNAIYLEDSSSLEKNWAPFVSMMGSGKVEMQNGFIPVGSVSC